MLTNQSSLSFLFVSAAILQLLFYDFNLSFYILEKIVNYRFWWHIKCRLNLIFRCFCHSDAGGIFSFLRIAKAFCNLQKPFANCKSPLRIAKAFCALQKPFAHCKSSLRIAKVLCALQKRRFRIERVFWQVEKPVLFVLRLGYWGILFLYIKKGS